MSDFTQTLKTMQQAMDRAPYAGVQLHVWSGDGVQFDHVIGSAGPGRPLTTDSLVRWLSASKPAVAVAVARLWEAGLLDIDAPVRSVVPQMAHPDITLRHLLTHTAAFGNDPPRGALVDDWDTAVATACASPLEPGTVPGRQAVYSTWTAFLLLGEIVRRVDGRRIEDYLREEAFVPLGMDDCYLAMAPDEYRASEDRIATLSHVTPDGPLLDPVLNDASLSQRCWPALGMRGPARQFARLFRALLPGAAKDVGKLLDPITVEAISRRQYVGIRYRSLAKNVSWGLGVLAGAEMFGPYCSARTFGGRGHGSSVAYADPEHGLVVACAWTGMLDDEGRHGARVRDLSAAIYEDLGLTTRIRRPNTVREQPTRAPNVLVTASDNQHVDVGRMLDTARGLDDQQIVALVERLGGPDALLDPIRDALQSAARGDHMQKATAHLTVTWPNGEQRCRLEITRDASVRLCQVDDAEAEGGLRLHLSGCDLIRLLTGELDVKVALAQRRLHLGGDMSLVATFLAVFGGSAFAIGTP